jgi:superfamily II DNA or RNA helicase
MILRDYQRSVLAALEESETPRNLAVMATGSGKTVVFAEYLRHTLRFGGRGLVIAHRDELITQAAAKIRELAPDLRVEIEKAELRASRTQTMFGPAPSVVVASVQTLQGRRLADWPRDAFACVVVDEAHHATAPSYRAIFDHFCSERTPLLGVTATAGRSDGTALGAVFERIVADLRIATLVQAGWLVPVRAFSVSSDVSLDGVSTRAGDFAQGELAAAVDDEGRNALVVAAYEEHAMGRQAIAYTAGVDHAHHLAADFRARGISAESVWGAMEEDDRRRILAAYTAGEITVLTNFGVLTEGFDAPNTACVIQARPTKSELLLTQMIGRGTRPAASLAAVLDAECPERRRAQIAASSKPDMVVLDIRDSLARGLCMSPASLAGLPPKFDPQGANVFAVKKALDALDPRLAARALSSADVHRFIKATKQGLSILEIDVLAAVQTHPEVDRLSRLTWSCIGEDRYALNVAGTKYALAPNALGEWVMLAAGVARPTGVTNAADAFAAADAHIAYEHPDELRLVDREARWRKQAASAKQVEWLLKKRVFASRESIPDSLTRGQATTLLDAAFAKRGPRIA